MHSDLNLNDKLTYMKSSFLTMMRFPTKSHIVEPGIITNLTGAGNTCIGSSWILSPSFIKCWQQAYWRVSTGRFFPMISNLISHYLSELDVCRRVREPWRPISLAVATWELFGALFCFDKSPCSMRLWVFIPVTASWRASPKFRLRSPADTIAVLWTPIGASAILRNDLRSNGTMLLLFEIENY